MKIEEIGRDVRYKAMSRSAEDRERYKEDYGRREAERIAAHDRRQEEWDTCSADYRKAIWESIPEDVRADLIDEAAEIIARNDTDGLNGPYGDEAEGLAFYVAVRSSPSWRASFSSLIVFNQEGLRAARLLRSAGAGDFLFKRSLEAGERSTFMGLEVIETEEGMSSGRPSARYMGRTVTVDDGLEAWIEARRT